MKIGVFDSGIGGITVLSEFCEKLGNAEYVYLGDTAHVPYGTKSPAQIEKLSVDCAKTLKSKNIDALVVACNTASSLALEAIQNEMGKVPVYGVVEPGILAALDALSTIHDDRLTAPILVLATRATIQSKAYGDTLRAKLDLNLVPGHLPIPIFEQACPLLVPIIEEGWIDHPILHQTIAEYVRPYLELKNCGIALLGCTHYPWIHQAFEKALPGWIVVNSAAAVRQTLQKSEFFKGRKPTLKKGERPHVEWIFTDPDAVPEFAKQYIQQILKKTD